MFYIMYVERYHKVVYPDSISNEASNPSINVCSQDKWLMELLTSFMPQELESEGKGSTSEGGTKGSMLQEHLRLIWPSVEAVRKSTKGWISGV